MSKSTERQLKLNTFWFVWNVVESIVLLIGGILAIVAGVVKAQDGSTFTTDSENAIAYMVSFFIVLDGLLRIIMYLLRFEKSSEQSPLVVGGFEISIGILFILVQVQFATQHIFTFTVVNLVAVMLMVMGALLLIYAILVIAKKAAKPFMPVMEIFFSAILVGVGIIIQVLYRTDSARTQLVLILCGVILSLVAIGIFVISLITRIKAKKQIHQAEEEEKGNFQVVDPDSAPRVNPDQAKVVDVEEVTHDNDEVVDASDGYIEGPKAIEHSKKKKK